MALRRQAGRAACLSLALHAGGTAGVDSKRSKGAYLTAVGFALLLLLEVGASGVLTACAMRASCPRVLDACCRLLGARAGG